MASAASQAHRYSRTPTTPRDSTRMMNVDDKFIWYTRIYPVEVLGPLWLVWSYLAVTFDWNLLLNSLLVGAASLLIVALLVRRRRVTLTRDELTEEVRRGLGGQVRRRAIPTRDIVQIGSTSEIMSSRQWVITGREGPFMDALPFFPSTRDLRRGVLALLDDPDFKIKCSDRTRRRLAEGLRE